MYRDVVVNCWTRFCTRGFPRVLPRNCFVHCLPSVRGRNFCFDMRVVVTQRTSCVQVRSWESLGTKLSQDIKHVSSKWPAARCFPVLFMSGFKWIVDDVVHSALGQHIGPVCWWVDGWARPRWWWWWNPTQTNISDDTYSMIIFEAIPCGSNLLSLFLSILRSLMVRRDTNVAFEIVDKNTKCEWSSSIEDKSSFPCIYKYNCIHTLINVYLHPHALTRWYIHIRFNLQISNLQLQTNSHSHIHLHSDLNCTSIYIQSHIECDNHIFILICIHIHILMHIDIHIHMRICIQIHMHTYIYMHDFIHIYNFQNWPNSHLHSHANSYLHLLSNYHSHRH